MRCFVWYDNEWGYANHLVKVALDKKDENRKHRYYMRKIGSVRVPKKIYEILTDEHCTKGRRNVIKSQIFSQIIVSMTQINYWKF